MTLSGKRALVTGGSRGVGAATVEMLAERGASVAVNYARSKDRADAVADKARSHGVTAVPIAADVSSPVGRAHAGRRRGRRLGRARHPHQQRGDDSLQ